jgi:hypothetical protein
METVFYTTVLDAIIGLKERGYNVDFNLNHNGINDGRRSLPADRFEITEVHRFEGDTSPDEEAVVYAIESRDGIKGTLVNGYGPSSDVLSDKMIEKLNIRHSA